LILPSLIIALVTLAGSIWLSVGMGLKACPLCFYQRTFVMGVVGVLAVGLLTGPRHHAVLNILALPMAVGGVGVALFHVYLELTGKLECPAGMLGIGTAPQQSLAALTVLLGVIVVGVVRGRDAEDRTMPALAAAILIGLLLSWASVASAPPMPPVPKKAYETPLDVCRPPFPGN
jgi:Disulfide bond formation protein DsbB